MFLNIQNIKPETPTLGLSVEAVRCIADTAQQSGPVLLSISGMLHYTVRCDWTVPSFLVVTVRSFACPRGFPADLITAG